MVKQIKILRNMKKNYVQPNTKVVLVKMEHHVLDISITDGKSGNPALSKGDMDMVMGKEDLDFGW